MKLGVFVSDYTLTTDTLERITAEKLGVNRKVLMPDAVEFMKTLDWPGNVRQLENVCRWLTVMASGNEIQQLDLPEDLQHSTTTKVVNNWQQ